MTVIKLTTVPDRKHFLAVLMLIHAYQKNHTKYKVKWIQFKLEETLGDGWKPDLIISMGNGRVSSIVVWEVQKELDKEYVRKFNDRLYNDVVGGILPLKKMPENIDKAFDWVSEFAIIWPKWVKVK